MGQAKLRGSKEERVREAQEATQAAEQQREQAKAARWAAMTPAQRDAALARAKREARNYGQLQEIFGHDVAMALSPLM